MSIRLLASFVFCLLFPLMGIAQEKEPINYDLWHSVASRAEKAIDTREGSDEVFNTLRKRIEDFRNSFDEARQQNKDRIQSLQLQIEALGPVPENPEDEPPELSAQREELIAQLGKLQAPVLVAEAAFNRANGLVSEIDNIFYARQRADLLSLNPSPLNPANWPLALGDFSNMLGELLAERRLFSDETARETLKNNALLVFLLLSGGLVLLFKGRRWVENTGGFLRSFGGQGTGIWGFVLSLMHVLVPMLGLYLLGEGLKRTGMLGWRGMEVVESFWYWGLLILGGQWLCQRLFPKDEPPLLPVSGENITRMRLNITLMSVVFVVNDLFRLLAYFSDVSNVALPVLTFPLILCISALLFRIGRILQVSVQMRTGEDGTEKATTFSRVLTIAGLGAILVSILVALLTAIGYGLMSDMIMLPTVYSLALFAAILILHQFITDVYCFVSNKGEAGRDALLPVLAGLFLLVCVLPVLSLIWGADLEDLKGHWRTFLQGFKIGETRVSPIDFLTFAILFSGGLLLTRLLQATLRNNVLPKTQIDKGGQNAIVSGLGYVGIFFAALISITSAGIDLSSLAIVAGALSVGIGFGLQNIVSNFVSGIILLIERPISEGDWIEVGGQHGTVRSISVRSTRIETFDRTDVIIPNADLVSGTVTNYTRGNTIGRLIINVGVAYGTDVKKVEQILQEIAQAQPMVLANPAPFILFSGFGADSLDFQIRMILRDVNFSLRVKNDVNHQILERFNEEGIEIPFAQRDIWLRNPEALQKPQV